MVRVGSMRPGPLLAALALVGAGALLLAPQGCGGTCNTGGQAAIDYTGGTTINGQVYETSTPTGTWLDFPAGRRYRLMHQLGTSDFVPHEFLAFSATPVPTDDASVGNYSQAAGNEVIVEAQTDTYVQVRNDTCADYYLRVVLTAIPSADAGGD